MVSNSMFPRHHGILRHDTMTPWYFTPWYHEITVLVAMVSLNHGKKNSLVPTGNINIFLLLLI